DAEVEVYAVVRGDGRRDLEFEHRILEVHGRLADTATAGLERDVTDFLALADRGFLLARGDHARRGNDFAAAFGLRGGQFEIQQVVGAEDRETEAARRRRGRQVHVEAVAERGHRDAAGGAARCAGRGRDLARLHDRQATTAVEAIVERDVLHRVVR